MERCVDKADASDFPRKSKPLDSLSATVGKSAASAAILRAKGDISAENLKSKVLKRKRSCSLGNGSSHVEFRKKRSGKEVSLNSFISGSGKSKVRLGVPGLKANGSFSGVGKRKRPSSSSGASRALKNASHASNNVGNHFTLPSSKEETQSSNAGDLGSSNVLEGGIIISKRPRGVSRRKIFFHPINSDKEIASTSSRIKNSIDQLKSKLPVSQSHTCQQKTKLIDLKEDGFTYSVSNCGTRISGNVDSIKTTKRRSRGRKVGSSCLDNKDSLHNSLGVFPDDDEDNLEQNAARMLSSRFDPSCAGFSHCRVGSGNPKKESSFVLSQRTSNGSDAEIIDTGRVLRPRNYGNRGFVRKRRHFYEVCFNNMDPYWVVKQRIRVFWPLDKCWYFGLVKDYDPVTKMHHVKYDDRDEEWINLQKERFKLLLFPSELANKFNHERSINEVKKKDKAGHKASMDEFSTRGLVETEPIISWLTRSTRQERPSALGIIKTQRRILTASKGSVGIQSTLPNLSSSLLNGSAEDESTENRVCSGSRKLPFVYSRRRIRKDRGYSGDVLEMISDHAGSAWPISMFDSIADAKLAVEELCNSVIPKVLTSVTVSLRSPIQDRCKSMCGSDSFLLCRSFFLNHKLIHLFPLVRMEVGFMDNLGINLFLFEGCLSLAVVLLCHTFRENYIQKGSHRSSNEKMTLKKIRINMLNLNNNGQRLYFSVDGFIERNSRWQYLENKLKQHCIRFNDVCPVNHAKSLSIRCSRPLVQPLKKTAPIEDCQKNKDKANFLSIEESDQVSDITLENFGSSSHAHLRVDTDAISLRYNGLEKTIEANGGARSVGYNDVGKSSSDKMFVRHRVLPGHMRSYKSPEDLCCPFRDELSSPEKSEGGCVSSSVIQTLRATRAEERTIFRGTRGDHSESSLLWEMNEHGIHSPNATARRSLWHHNRHNFDSPILGPRPSLWSEDFIQSGFLSTTKKPRTQVSYPALSRSHDIRLKNRIHHRKGSLYKKLRNDLPRKTTVGLESHRSFHESLICHANVLITTGDRGWRELGAEVILDSDDQKDWKILIKLSGVTKYMYKAHQVLQPGIPNRYTHAMMWRGGKDWSLEFSDRNQWLLFKMMHGQCFNQNIRAASVKNIPIPGVRLIEDPKDSFTEVPYVRTSSKYYQLAGTEVDMALDPSHVLYDMDTDDENWVLKFRDSLNSNDSSMLQMTDDMFERVMDMFERIAYVNQCDILNDDEISEYMADFGSLDIVKAIHEFWHEKRKKNDMPLIRQYQPPLWERYHQQLKEWELTMLKFHYQANECQQEKMTAAPEKLPEKPPMFAFCLKPRGLEANKGSKQRSHKKLMYAGHHSSFSREQDGRRLNASFAGDEKALVAIPSFEGSHSTQWLQSSTSFSPKLIRHFSKKNGLHHSSWDPSAMSFSYDENLKRNGVYRWNSDTSEWPNSKQFQPDGSQRHPQQPDASEFRFRDSAQRASNVAKLKREKAQWLMHKADLALHKAVLAIMTADAIKTSQNDSTGDDE